MELFCRCLLVCCVRFDKTHKHSDEEPAPPEEDEEDAEAPAPKAPANDFQSYNPHEQFDQPDSHAMEDQEDKMNLIGNAAAGTKVVAAAGNTRNQ